MSTLIEKVPLLAGGTLTKSDNMIPSYVVLTIQSTNMASIQAKDFSISATTTGAVKFYDDISLKDIGELLHNSGEGRFINSGMVCILLPISDGFTNDTPIDYKLVSKSSAPVSVTMYKHSTLKSSGVYHSFSKYIVQDKLREKLPFFIEAKLIGDFRELEIVYNSGAVETCTKREMLATQFLTADSGASSLEEADSTPFEDNPLSTINQEDYVYDEVILDDSELPFIMQHKSVTVLNDSPAPTSTLVMHNIFQANLK